MLITIKDYLTSNNKAWIGVGILIIGVTVSSIFFKNQKRQLRNKKSKQPNKIQQSKVTQIIEQQQNNQHAFHNYYFDKTLQIRKVIDKIQGNVNVEEIYLNSPVIMADQYKKFTNQIRNRRRLIRTINQNQYIQLVMQYENEVDQLLERSRQELLDQCQIDLQQFQRMKDAFQCSQNLQDLVRKSKKILKEFTLQAIRQIPVQKLKRIIQTELNFIKTKMYQRLKQKLAIEYNLSQDEILKIIRTLIDDILYEKFGYQREQIQRAINQSMGDIIQLRKQRQMLQNQISNISLQSQNESEDEKKMFSYKKSVGKTQSNVGSSIEQPFQLNLEEDN